MRRNVLCLLVFLTTLVVALPTWAQQAPELNEIVVTATRIDSPILESPSAVSVITSADIAASGATDVSQLLADQSGVTVNDYGAIGATKNASLRGSTSDQVLVLIDGLRVNSSRISTVDFSTIPVEMIDRIEVLRGGASTTYGSGAIGGVINIITKRTSGPEITLSLTNGSYVPHDANAVSSTMALTPVQADARDLVDSQSVSFTAAGSAGELGLNGGASFTRAANAYTWIDTAVIDGWRRRTNADVLSGSVFGGFNLPVLGGWFALKEVLDVSDTGAPGRIDSPWVSTTARQGDTTASTILSWKSDHLAADTLTLDVKGLYRYDRLSYTDPAYSIDSLHQTHTLGLDITQKWSPSDSISTVYGASAYYDYALSTNFAAIKDRLNLAGFLSIPVNPVETLTVTPAIRYDYFSDTAGSFSGSLSAVLLLSDRASLRASLESGYRAPTFNDLYWSDPYTVTNPNLKPETSYGGEVGWSFELPAVSVDASLFTRLVFNNISWWTDPNTFITYVLNFTKTLFPGAEFHAKINLTDTVSVEGSYTMLYTFLLNDGFSEFSLSDNLRVPNTPVHKASVGLRYAGTAFAAGIDGEYVSDKYLDSSNTTTIPAYFVMSADVKYFASKTVTLSLAAKNLLNSLYYTQLNYPMPPLSIETGVRLHL